MAPSPTYMLKSSEDYYRKFKQSIKSKDTFVTYDHRLKSYMKYKGIAEGQYSQLIEGKDVKQIEEEITDFVIFIKERNYSLSSQQGYLNALNHFYDINDVTIRRKKISKFLSNDDNNVVTLEDNDNDGDSSGGGGDTPYIHEQIAKLLDFADIRTKVIILLMSSSGMRLRCTFVEGR